MKLVMTILMRMFKQMVKLNCLMVCLKMNTKIRLDENDAGNVDGNDVDDANTAV